MKIKVGYIQKSQNTDSELKFLFKDFLKAVKDRKCLPAENKQDKFAAL